MRYRPGIFAALAMATLCFCKLPVAARGADRRQRATQQRDASVRALVQQLAGQDCELVEMRLGELHRTSLNALMAGLSDRNPTIRIRCARMLGKIGDCRALGPLRKASHDGDRRVRIAIADTLESMPCKDAAEALGAMFADPDAAVREAASTAAGRRQPSGNSAYRKWCSNTNPSVRVAAAAALQGWWGSSDPKDLPVLVALSHDADGLVRATAVRSILAQGKQQVSTVLAASNDPDPRVREASAESMRMMLTADCVPSLKRLLGDPAPQVRRAALETI